MKITDVDTTIKAMSMRIRLDSEALDVIMPLCKRYGLVPHELFKLLASNEEVVSILDKMLSE